MQVRLWSLHGDQAPFCVGEVGIEGTHKVVSCCESKV